MAKGGVGDKGFTHQQISKIAGVHQGGRGVDALPYGAVLMRDGETKQKLSLVVCAACNQ